jgi:hypothetical protein
MNEQTITRMRQMKFFGMLRAFQTSLESGKFNDLTADEMVSHLIMEATVRTQIIKLILQKALWILLKLVVLLTI